MNEPVDILLLGSGPFAARIAFDLAATAQRPTRVLVAARDPRRLAWVRTTARGRAALFATPARFTVPSVDLLADGVSEALLAKWRPRVIVQAASDASCATGLGPLQRAAVFGMPAAITVGAMFDTAPAWWQAAAWRGANARIGGSTRAHTSVANGQRG